MDNFTRENMSLVSEEDLVFFKTTDIKVEVSADFNEDFEIVHEGAVHDLLVDNQYDENLVETLLELKSNNLVEVREVSGIWKFLKK